MHAMKHTPVIKTESGLPVNRRLWLAGALTAPWLTLTACSDSSQPSVADTPFTLLDGQSSSTHQLKGGVVLVNFWATSCSTCVQEMPDLVATYDKYHPRGFDLLAVAMSFDPPEYVSGFAASRKLPFKVALDKTGQMASNFGNVQITPTSFLLDKQGRIVKRYVGKPDMPALHALIEELLAA